MKVYTCKYCNKDIEFKNIQSYAGHVGGCSYNLNYEQRNKKISLANKGKQRKNIPEKKERILNCKKCNTEYNVKCTDYIFRKGFYKKYCSKSCANSHYRSQESRQKTSNAIKEKWESIKRTDKFPFLKIKKCIICGENKNIKECNCPGLMVIKNLFSKNLLFNKLGTIELLLEYEKLVANLKYDYEVKNISIGELKKKYKWPLTVGSFSSLLKTLGIKLKTLSEAVSNLILNGGIITYSPPKYKSGKHHTWYGDEVYLRSSYEFDFAKKLDEQKLYYEVEKIRIKYFDSTKNKERIAVVDFYIPEQNKLIEIKSNYTLKKDLIVMTDKIKKYKELGYNFELWVDKKLYENY